MTIARETSLGTVSVSNILFAQIILESFQQEDCLDKIWASTKRGRQITSDQKNCISEFAGSIEAETGLDGESVDLTFPVIVKFGAGIGRLTDAAADYIAESLAQKLGKKPGQITIRIAGVKSKQIARRNLEVVKRYAAE